MTIPLYIPKTLIHYATYGAHGEVVRASYTIPAGRRVILKFMSAVIQWSALPANFSALIACGTPTTLNRLAIVGAPASTLRWEAQNVMMDVDISGQTALQIVTRNDVATNCTFGMHLHIWEYQ